MSSDNESESDASADDNKTQATHIIDVHRLRHDQRNRLDLEDEFDQLEAQKKKLVNIDRRWAFLYMYNQEFRKKLVHELIIYISFLVCFMTVIFLTRDVPSVYEMEASVRDLIAGEEFLPEDTQIRKTFYEIGEFSEFFQFLLGPFYNQVYATEWYNGQNLTSIQRQSLNIYNRVVGAVRLRQLRVKDNSCAISRNYNAFTSECFDYYNENSRSTSAYGPTTNPEKYTWYCGSNSLLCTVRDSLQSYNQDLPFSLSSIGIDCCENVTNADGIWSYSQYSALRPVYYDASGFVWDVEKDSDARSKLTELKQDLWADGQTRAIFVVFTVLNQNLNLFMTVQLITEFSPSGSFTNTVLVKPFRLDLLVTVLDYVRLLLEVAFVVFVAYYVLAMFGDIRDAYETTKTQGGSILTFFKFFSMWNYLEFLNNILFIIGICLRVVFLVRVQLALSSGKLDITTNKYFDVENLATLFQLEANIQSFNVLLSFLKTFKYLQLNVRMNLLWKTLAHASSDLVAFIFFFGLVFLAYATMAHVLFGPEIQGFATYNEAIASCFSMLTGNIDYSDLNLVNRVLGPLFFYSFIILVFLILVNVFLAIITDAYGEVHEKSKSEYTIAQELLQFTESQLHKVSRAGKKLKRVFTSCVNVKMDESHTEISKHAREVPPMKLASNIEQIRKPFLRYQDLAMSIGLTETDALVSSYNAQHRLTVEDRVTALQEHHKETDLKLDNVILLLTAMKDASTDQSLKIEGANPRL
jgi:hypothetical protein